MSKQDGIVTWSKTDKAGNETAFAMIDLPPMPKLVEVTDDTFDTILSGMSELHESRYTHKKWTEADWTVRETLTIGSTIFTRKKAGSND